MWSVQTFTFRISLKFKWNLKDALNIFVHLRIKLWKIPITYVQLEEVYMEDYNLYLTGYLFIYLFVYLFIYDRLVWLC